MKKCVICGLKGLFVKLNENGICQDCVAVANRQKVLDGIEAKLADRNKLMSQIQTEALKEIEKLIHAEENKLSALSIKYYQKNVDYAELDEKYNKTNKSYESATKKIVKLKNLYNSMKYAYDDFNGGRETDREVSLVVDENEFETLLAPTVKLSFHCMDVKELRKQFNENRKNIDAVSESYQGRYTTKANATIYKLMVIALDAELQNVIYSLNTGKLDSALLNIKKITNKYLQIATDGNQQIASTIIKFVGQIEFLFQQAIKIEYEYYVKKEKIKEEQRLLREQMKQEAEERKILEQQKKQVEAEEEKYKKEIENLKQQQLLSSDEDKNKQYFDKISELENLLLQVNEKKEDIIKLQNGKAGYVYVISNLGSFGDTTFKIGMTRRLEPQERIDELGSASVPFPFDVHSFIFSEDAVSLENSLHKLLHENRVNKINFRKEFFETTVAELETLVQELEPTAEFKTTMLAEQYRQSLSIKDKSIEAFGEDEEFKEVATDNTESDDEDAD